MGTRRIREERVITDKTMSVTQHKAPYDDILLNTAQMRDALHVQRFRIPSPVLNADEITMFAVQREVQGRKAPSTQLRQQLAGSGRGRGTSSRAGRGLEGQRGGTRLQRARGRSSSNGLG